MGVIHDRWAAYKRQQILDQLALVPADLPAAMATDAEVSAAIATLASTTASDAELAAAQATLNTAIATKTTAAQAAAAAPVQTVFGRTGAVTASSTDLSDGALVARHKGVWTVNTSWTAGDIVQITSAVANGYPVGLWRCLSTHLGGMTFTGTSVGNWVQIASLGSNGNDYLRSGYYSWGVFASGGVVGQNLNAGVCVWSPFVVPVRRAFDRIGVNVSTVGGVGSVVRLGIYSGAGRPEALILDAGTVISTTTGAKEATIAQTLDAGVYWLAAAAQVGACSLTSWAANQVTPYTSPSTTVPSSVGSTHLGGWYATGITGALPSSAAVEGTTQAVLNVLRAA